MTNPGHLADADAAELKEIRTACPHLDAVTAALSSPWSSGQVEGHVTRVKLLKRMGFGRANLDLLRRRILIAT
ncbi:transposase [Streptomyces sp. NPDC048484]|uniref:transposase n=1 Tax=Streptomyces sp. NPDC048484 TaxID=3155146 RepID=UPI00341615B1